MTDITVARRRALGPLALITVGMLASAAWAALLVWLFFGFVVGTALAEPALSLPHELCQDVKPPASLRHRLLVKRPVTPRQAASARSAQPRPKKKPSRTCGPTGGAGGGGIGGSIDPGSASGGGAAAGPQFGGGVGGGSGGAANYSGGSAASGGYSYSGGAGGPEPVVGAPGPLL